jgi:hypothetical protein
MNLIGNFSVCYDPVCVFSETVVSELREPPILNLRGPNKRYYAKFQEDCLWQVWEIAPNRKVADCGMEEALQWLKTEGV